MFPVWVKYSKPQFQFTCLLPFYYSQKDDAQGSSVVYYFPVYGRIQKGDHSTRRLFMFPAFGWHIDRQNNSKSFDLLWPLCHYESSPTKKAFRLWPFFLRSS